MVTAQVSVLPSARNTVMVVDDQSTHRTILEEVIGGLDEQVMVEGIASAVDALAWAAGRVADLVVVDYMMPEMDGIELVKRLRALPGYQHVPIVMVTVNDDRDVRYAALEAGTTDFLSKPVNARECVARCRNLLTLRRQQLALDDRRRLERTNRTHAEEALRESEERFRGLTELSSDWYWEQDENYRFTDAGRDGSGSSLLRGGSGVGRTRWEIHAQSLSPEQWAAHRRQLEAHEPFHELEYERPSRDRKLRWVRVSGRPIFDAHGKFKGYRGITKDITAPKEAEAARARLEAQLRESQKMEALGTLAGGVAHDFNNILAAIMGNVELARQDVGPAHAALESLEEIRKASRRAKDLILQILAFSRRQTLEREVISLVPVMEESTRLLRATLPAGVGLTVNFAADAPMVLADATQIEQVLLNLCANAWQAMQGQERARTIEVELEAHVHAPCGGGRSDLQPGCYACLTVRDTGSGMEEATRQRIFEPFFTTKPLGQGTGLGLAVVHGIVHGHGGCITVQSASGEGTTFRIYLPAAEPPVRAVAAHASETMPTHGRGRHVLYVDDDEAVVFMMKRLLERRGYRVSAYTDAREALAAVRASPDQFHLVVTDYNMPCISGLEMASELRAIRGDLPVGISSGYITEELRIKASAAGVRELIHKPESIDDLCEAVARLANAQR